MKIAIVHPSLKTKGGAENVVVWLAEELSRRGHQVDIYTTDYDEEFFGPKKSKKFHVYEMDLGGYEIDPVKWISNGWRLKNKLEDYDFINPHNFPSYIWIYFAKIFNFKLPKVIWFCEEPFRIFYRDITDSHVLQVLKTDAEIKKESLPLIRRLINKIDNYGLKTPLVILKYRMLVKREKTYFKVAKFLDHRSVLSLDRIVTNSQFIADNVSKIFHIKATACLLGIPIEDSRKRLEFQSYILTVSRLHYEKNIFNIIRAVKLLVKNNKFPVKKYIIAGSGPLFDQLGKFIMEEGLSHIIELKGFVSSKDLDLLYSKTSLVVYLPLDETYGLIFPEAGLYKKPVIGPSHGGPKEIVLDGITGYQVDPLDPKQIAEKISLMFKDNKKLQEMGRSNYDFVINKLSFTAFTDRFLAIIQQTL